MEGTIIGLQELKEMNTELEAYQTEEIKQLRGEIEKRDVMIGNLRENTASLQQRNIIIEQEINAYRQRLIDNHQTLQMLQQQQHDKEQQMTEMQSKTNTIMAHNLQLIGQAKDVKSALIQQEMIRIEFDFLNKNIIVLEVCREMAICKHLLIRIEFVSCTYNSAGTVKYSDKFCFRFCYRKN